jgi:mono/diheme cytochrome c family protein
MNLRSRSSLGIIAAVLAALVGCEQAPPPQFHLNEMRMVENETPADYQQEIADVLGAMFGTPDQPFAFPESGLTQTRLTLAAGAAYNDTEGVSHGLYRRHCVHCHGITGDGRGPTARFLNPYPRDYRSGVFKFKTTFAAAKPTDEDLKRIMHNGAPGTAMPSFSLLPNSEVEALVEYVKYLAMRGEMEQRLNQYVYDELADADRVDEKGNPVLDENGNPLKGIRLNPAANPAQQEAVKSMMAEVVAPWNEAKDQVIAPTEEQIPKDDRPAEEIAASIKKGRDLFFSPQKGNCFSCHGPTALGDGQQNDFDVWTKEQKAFLDKTEQLKQSVAERDEQKDLSDDDKTALERDRRLVSQREEVIKTFYPLRNAIPRNLRKGIYRGGRRRIDIFARIHQGIPGMPMPGVGGSGPGVQGTLTEAEIWNIVDYVLSLPYEPISGPQTALPENVAEVTK